MAETAVDHLLDTILKELKSLDLQEIQLGWCGMYQMDKLEKTLSTIKSVVLAAEERQVEISEVNVWLERLKSAVYDADDLLDEIMTEDRRRVEIRGNLIEKVWNYLSPSNPVAFYWKMGIRFMQIRKTLNEIDVKFSKFQLGCGVANIPIEPRRVRTFSFMDKSDVIGRKNDKEKIIEILIAPRGNENITVVPIVGIGGLGKTALAKLVYNDNRVIRHFELRMWVCVSDHLDIKKVTKKILKSVTDVLFDDLEIDQLQSCLEDNINARRFILVLDDFQEQDIEKWKELKGLLNRGANGSTIIVTTRSGSVASKMATSPSCIYKLSVLSDDDCWSLFVKFAFREGQVQEHPNLVRIGKSIVEKCGGVPLAVRILASQLYMKGEEHDWLFIEHNKLWESALVEDNILPLLRLSYDQMPSYLKHCLAYCSLFPRDHEFSREDLIHVWMAQGFVRFQSDDKNQQLEGIGDQYFEELLSASFLEAVDDGYDSKIVTCKMHNLLHDLVQSVMGTEFLVLNLHTNNISEMVRHVSFSDSDLSRKDIPESFLKLRKVRTSMFSPPAGPNYEPCLHKLTSICRHLRVLDLSYSKIKELPSPIGKLKQLRYLNLSQNCYIQALPRSICKLRNLQTLQLDGCVELQRLPKQIGQITSLRHLEMTIKAMLLSGKGMGGLTSLQLLTFIRCQRLRSLFEEMKHFSSLQKLRVCDCPRLSSLPNSMKYLTSLESLEICNCSELNLLEGEGMEGLKSLRSLLLVRLPMLVALPLGLQQAATTLQYLSISACYNLIALPQWLGNLTLLKRLQIHECPNLMSLPEGMCLPASLQVLHIYECHRLRRRCQREEGEDWPKIAHVPEIYLDNVNIKSTN